MTPGDLDNALCLLIENAYQLADDEKLYGVDKKVAKSHEPDFKVHSFGKYIRYAGRGRYYTEWIDAVLQVLDKYGLNSAKYRVRINEYDPEHESNLPAQLFMRALKELERIHTDKLYRATYIITARLPEVSLRNNVLSQGSKKHSLNDRYSKLLHLLWSGRQIKDPSGKIIKNEKPITKSMICAQLKIDDTSLADMQRNVSGIRKKSDIQISLYFPRRAGGVFLSVTQSI